MKLQSCRTIVLVNKPLLKGFQSTSFSKATVVIDSPPRKTPVAHAISRQEKMAFSTPRRDVSELPSPSPSPRVCTGEQAGGRSLTSQPKFLGSIGYQICLAMVLRYNLTPVFLHNMFYKLHIVMA